MKKRLEPFLKYYFPDGFPKIKPFFFNQVAGKPGNDYRGCDKEWYPHQ